MKKIISLNAILDILILAGAFLIFIWIKPASKRIYLPLYIKPFLGFLFLWLVVSFVAQKYSLSEQYKQEKAIFHIFITNAIITGIVSLLMFAFQTFFFSRLIVFGTIALATFLEVIIVSLQQYWFQAKESVDVSSAYQEFSDIIALEPELKKRKRTKHAEIDIPEMEISIKQGIIEESSEKVYEYISRLIDIENSKNTILSTTTRFNIVKLPQKNYQAIINLKRINDIDYINHFFEAVSAKLDYKGYFIGCVETTMLRKKRLLKKFPPILNRIYYFFDYFLKRVFPKFPITKQIYNLLTRKQNQVISEPETYGRLYSCGFEVIGGQEINGMLYFTAKKADIPAFDVNPTYGPFVKLRRIGKNGKIIYVYKLRTMHPFAEYLQDYIYKKHNLKEGGKFKSDFRITTFGKFARKLWLDELPMLINLFRGELKLVGVRPLSEQYFKLYNKELQKRRIRVKPGLVPPFYVDLPKSLEEIQKSEMKYLDAYDKRPLLTDWRYFWKAFINIAFKKARSN